jgi:hypothetical protein
VNGLWRFRATVRRQMPRHWAHRTIPRRTRSLSLGAAQIPEAFALLEHDSIHDLAQSSASMDAMRRSLK